MSGIGSIFYGRLSRFILVAAITVSASLLGGCGGDPDRVPVYPVRGKVLLDGEPASGAYVEFIQKKPTEKSKNLDPITGTDEKGEFLLATYNYADGAPEGEYNVLVNWPTPDDMTELDSYPENWEYLREVYGDRENPQFEAVIKWDPESDLDAIVIPPFELYSEAESEYE